MENTKARREAAALVFVVFLLGVVFGALGNHLWGQRVRGERAAANTRPTRDQVIKGFTDELQLTPAQQSQLTTIVDDTRAKWQALYAPLEPQKEQVRQQCRANIRAILTPEQQVKFDEFMRQLDENRKREAAH